MKDKEHKHIYGLFNVGGQRIKACKDCGQVFGKNAKIDLKTATPILSKERKSSEEEE